jgi:hypothetical protein
MMTGFLSGQPSYRIFRLRSALSNSGKNFSKLADESELYAIMIWFSPILMAKALPFVVIGGAAEGDGYVHWYASSLPLVSFIDIFSDDAEVKLHPNFCSNQYHFVLQYLQKIMAEPLNHSVGFGYQ